MGAALARRRARPAGQGIGDALLGAVEAHVARAGGRVLFVETSALPRLERARRLYADRGYDVASVDRNHYGEGDDRVTFCKRLA